MYESLWGNTAAIARAVADGLGEGARALFTAEAIGPAIAEADLIVAGAPVLGFRLPTEAMRQSVVSSARNAPTPPDLSHPSMRSSARLAAQRPRPLGCLRDADLVVAGRGATGPIADTLGRAGYPPLTKAHCFVVEGKYGPLRDGELERARRWGAELAQAMG